MVKIKAYNYMPVGDHPRMTVFFSSNKEAFTSVQQATVLQQTLKLVTGKKLSKISPKKPKPQEKALFYHKKPYSETVRWYF